MSLPSSEPSLYSHPTRGYASQWNFTGNKKLLLDNQSRFYAKTLVAPFYDYPAVQWLFGTKNQNTGASEITIWRYDP